MSFIYQKWIKWESETAIINALFEGDKRFGELLELTDLSKPVLIKRLKELKKKGKIEFVPDEETRRFSYHLISNKIDFSDEIQKKIDLLSKAVVKMLKFFAIDPETSNLKYTEYLTDLIHVLFRYRMWAYNIAPKGVQREWLKNCLGLDFVKNIPKIYPENRNLYSELTPLRELFEIKRIKDFENMLKAIDELLHSQFKKIKDTYDQSIIV